MKFTYASHRIGWLFIATIGTFLGSTWSSAQAVEQPDSSTLHYPIAHRGDQVDDYHGTKVADPHRWLENVDSAETRDWVKAENQLTNGYLEKLHEREAIRRMADSL